MDEWSKAREQMVVEQLEARGIRHRGVLEAMRRVPRHAFVPAALAGSAYADRALPIGDGQTISQPYMVARMTEALVGDEVEGTRSGRLLEIGTGSGYQAAILSLLASRVISIERRPELADAARERLEALGFANIVVLDGDGSADLPDDSLCRGPFDGILVTAGAPHVPSSLKAQLSIGARLVVPVGSQFRQVLTVITRKTGGFEERAGEECVFVPLIGRDGWPPERL
jgi:protein-L-isoaspartate(D-aspartate) O-methyltransferase